MKRIAVIFEGGLDNLTGLTNAVLNRVAYLGEVSEYAIDVYDILSYPFGLSRLLFPKSKYHKMKSVVINGITINMLWYRNMLLDSIVNFKLHKKPLFLDGFLQSNTSLFKDYDLISAHAFVGAKMAYQINKKYGIPFCVTWHGSEIHSIPNDGKYQRRYTKAIMEKADCNFFVSKALLKSAQVITTGIKAKVLYNGVNDSFCVFPSQQRNELRKKYEVAGAKVVAFVGNLKAVKNAALLPDIFKKTKELFRGEIKFWVVGSGEEHNKILQRAELLSIPVRMWGHQPVAIMPELLQCVDVLVLPSKEEGLGMVLLEAIACGANAVGSNVGGIAEAIGMDNAIPLGSNFVDNIASRIVYYLCHNEVQHIPNNCSWRVTSRIEKETYDSLL